MPETEHAEFPLSGKRVVVIDEDGITLMHLRRCLVLLGMAVVGVATNGRTGVETVLRERPDVVLMEVHLPEIDGIEAARQIRAQHPCCLVLVTAFPPEVFEYRTALAGISGYLAKPVFLQTLGADLARAWAEHEAPDLDPTT